MEDWLVEAYKKLESMPKSAREIRKLAEEDLYFFAKLVNPGYMYGSIHKEVFKWLESYNLFGMGESLTSNKLLLLPRAHLKSHIIATAVAWLIVRHPDITILYVSATAELAMTQLYDIKNILDSNVFKKYWPEYIHPDVGKREKWSATKIIVDHLKRKQEGVRDPTIATAGLTTNTTGWHADVICSDDIVVPENAYTEDGRETVAKKSSQFTSIRNTGGFTLACGTRYHPSDVYATWKEQVTEIYNKDGEHLGKALVWDIKEYPVEDEGVFLWPRVVREDGKAYGFDHNTLARIKSEYIDRTQFFAQYYNNPNDSSLDRISRDTFQYLNPRFLRKEGSAWYYNNNRLNIYAAIDFAYSLNAAADYTAIVVIGVDHLDNVFVLDIDRFKSLKTIEYFKHIASLHAKWNFKKLQTEITAAQATISESIKDFIRQDGLVLSVVEHRPSKVEGSKEQRIAAVLEHKYENRQMWHTEGGWTRVLEEELVMAKPPHDDIKDALASAVSIAVKPARAYASHLSDFLNNSYKASRFGGVR